MAGGWITLPCPCCPESGSGSPGPVLICGATDCHWPCSGLFLTLVYVSGGGAGGNCLDGLTLPLSCTGTPGSSLTSGMVALPAGCGGVAGQYCVMATLPCVSGALNLELDTFFSFFHTCTTTGGTACDQLGTIAPGGLTYSSVNCAAPSAVYGPAPFVNLGLGCVTPVLGAIYRATLHT